MNIVYNIFSAFLFIGLMLLALALNFYWLVDIIRDAITEVRAEVPDAWNLAWIIAKFMARGFVVLCSLFTAAGVWWIIMFVLSVLRGVAVFFLDVVKEMVVPVPDKVSDKTTDQL